MKYAFFLANVDLLCVVMQLIYEGDKIYSGLFIFLSSSDDSDDNDDNDEVDVDRKSIFSSNERIVCPTKNEFPGKRVLNGFVQPRMVSIPRHRV